jgi:hypothetical protein
MTSFADMLTQVYTITGRPDLVTETTLALKQATLKAHNSDFFPRDIYETGISFAAADYIQQFDYQSVLPRWRALKYIRKFDSVNNSAGKFLKVITPEQILDGYGNEKADICYQAGSKLQIKTYEQNQYFLLGCYLNPSVDPLNYISWIAEVQPDAIVVLASAAIFKMVGFDEQASMYTQLAADQLGMLKVSYLQTIGY